MSTESDAYAKHQNLKLAAKDLGIPWQTLYVRLRKQGVSVTGNKSRYGGASDKLASHAESIFQGLVPCAKDMNLEKWQSKYDFTAGTQRVDVKASRKNRQSKRSEAMRWSFLFSKQAYECDFFCCFCLGEADKVEHVLLVPQDVVGAMQTMSVSCTSLSKWMDFEVKPHELAAFFDAL